MSIMHQKKEPGADGKARGARGIQGRTYVGKTKRAAVEFGVAKNVARVLAKDCPFCGRILAVSSNMKYANSQLCFCEWERPVG